MLVRYQASSTIIVINSEDYGEVNNLMYEFDNFVGRTIFYNCGYAYIKSLIVGGSQLWLSPFVFVIKLKFGSVNKHVRM